MLPPVQLPLVAAIVVALAFAAASAQTQRGSRVAPDARDIPAFRISELHLTGLERVGQALAREYRPAPEKPRADAAMFTVLSMSLAYNQPFSDRTVVDTVRTIESGHPDLHAAIRAAGVTTTDYVLTQITLLLAAPVVASEKAGRPIKAPATDTAIENVEFVRRRWPVVEAILKDLGNAAGRSR